MSHVHSNNSIASHTLLGAFGLPNTKRSIWHAGERRSPSGRTPLSRRPFLRDCTDPSLKDTKNSIFYSLVYSIRAYSDPEAKNIRSCAAMERDFEASLKIQRLNTAVHEIKYSQDQYDDELSEDGIPIYKKKSNSPPILINYERNASDQILDTLIKLLQRCLTYKLELSDHHMKCPLVQDIMRYVINIYVLRFKSPTIDGVLQNIIFSKGKHGLETDLSNMRDDVLDQYESITLDDFEDILFEKSTNPLSTNLKTENTQNPSIYSAFKRVWLLDKESFNLFDARVYLDNLDDPESHLLALQTHQENLVNHYGVSVIKMNTLKFVFSFRAEAQVDATNYHKCAEIPDETFLINELAGMLKRIPNQARQQRRSKHLKSLRFV